MSGVLGEFPVTAGWPALGECESAAVAIPGRKVRALLTNTHVHFTELVADELTGGGVFIQPSRSPFSDAYRRLACRAVGPGPGEGHRSEFAVTVHVTAVGFLAALRPVAFGEVATLAEE